MQNYTPFILKGHLSPKGHLRDIADYEAHRGYAIKAEKNAFNTRLKHSDK